LRGQPYDLFVMLLFVLVTSYLLSWIAPYSFAQAQQDMQKVARGIFAARPAKRRGVSTFPAAAPARIGPSRRVA